MNKREEEERDLKRESIFPSIELNSIGLTRLLPIVQFKRGCISSSPDALEKKLSDRSTFKKDSFFRVLCLIISCPRKINPGFSHLFAAVLLPHLLLLTQDCFLLFLFSLSP